MRKCPYCDFNSHQASQEIPEQAYIKALLADLQQDLPWAQGRRLSSIFFGGGTPSLFSAAGIGEILTAAERLIGFENDIEITLEANPGTVEQTTFADFSSAGINRLSIGIQSFDDAHLLKLGRIHDGKQAQSAIATVQSAGFQRFNIDLMHGLPGQTVAEAARDIQYAIDGGAVHISWYQLTIEPNTAFYSRPPELPEEDQLSDIQQAGMDMLFDGGYGQYEVSAFAKTGQQARHNINYWEFGDYLGIGAGAHGKITLPSHQQIIRTSKTRQPDHYLSRATSALAKQQTIASDELAMEFMLNGLRLRAGVPKQYFTERTGLPESAIAKQVARLQAQGLLEIDEQRYRTTALGYQFLNSVLQGFS